jgi:pimeloyl-ACP methyl ester carboxylesterase
MCIRLITLILICSSPLFGFQNPFPEKEDLVGVSVETLVLRSGPFLKYKADYGILSASENRGSDASRRIHIPVVRIRSPETTDRPPLFYFTGGPGNPNVPSLDEYVKAGLDDLSWPWILELGDLVWAGYRGVDGVDRLLAPEFTKAIQLTVSPLSEESLKTFGKALMTDFQAMQDRGIDVNGYNVVEMADDIEGLGYEKINLLSISFGTQVAYTYCLKYPEHVARNLMLAPDAPGHTGIWDPATIDEQIRAYADLWEADSVCTEQTSDLIGTIRSVMDSLAQGLHPPELDPDKARMMMFLFLYNTGSAVHVFDGLVRADTRRFEGLTLMNTAYNMGFAVSLNWGDFFAKLLSLGDAERTIDYVKALDPPGSILGSPLSKWILGTAQFAGWPVKPIPDKYRGRMPLVVPTLLVSGNLDFSSPPDKTEKTLLPTLTNGEMRLLYDMGHGDIVELQPEAFRSMVMTYFSSGKVDVSGYKHNAVDFHPKQTFLQWLMGQR